MEQIQFIYFQYYMQYYTVHHKENSTYLCGNLASWMMVKAPPSTASLFWFYYNLFIKKESWACMKIIHVIKTIFH